MTRSGEARWKSTSPGWKMWHDRSFLAGRLPAQVAAGDAPVAEEGRRDQALMAAAFELEAVGTGAVSM